MGTDDLRPSDARKGDPAPVGAYLVDQSGPFLDMLPLGICICDRQGNIVRYNRSAAQLWDHTPRLGEPVDAFWSRLKYRLGTGPSHKAAIRLAGDVLSDGAPIRDLQMLLDRDDGSSVFVRINVDALRDKNGAITGVVICIRDITDSQRLRTVLQDSERHSHKLLEALPVAVYTTDTAGRITFFNQAAVELWGRAPKLGEDQWCGSHVLRWPDGRPMRHDECPMAVSLREQRAIRGAEAVAERPDGSFIHFLAYPTPVRDDSGILIGAINTLVDITERKRGEESARYLASIVDSSNDAIISRDLNGVITSWNLGAERLYGYTAREAIGKPVTILIPPDRRDEETENLRQIQRGQRIGHYDTVRQRKDGSPVEVSLTVSPIKNAFGVIVGASKIARDITERRRATEKQVLLLREMSHRVKNLFALASGVVTLSARFARTPEEMADSVRARLNALSQAHDLTLPDFTNGAERSEKRTTLHALIQTIIAPYSDVAREGSDRIFIDGPEVQIGGSAMTSLALLLHEFTTNAAKYGALSGSTGRIDVRWTVANDELHLTWRETGGPPVGDQVHTEGFGSLLARATVKGQLGGSFSRDWETDGLTIHLTVSLGRLTR